MVIPQDKDLNQCIVRFIYLLPGSAFLWIDHCSILRRFILRRRVTCICGDYWAQSRSCHKDIRVLQARIFRFPCTADVHLISFSLHLSPFFSPILFSQMKWLSLKILHFVVDVVVVILLPPPPPFSSWDMFNFRVVIKVDTIISYPFLLFGRKTDSELWCL